MKPELRKRIIQYNKAVAEKSEKAEDFEIILNALKKLPFGQLKKVLTEEILAVFKKYGLEADSDGNN